MVQFVLRSCAWIAIGALAMGSVLPLRAESPRPLTAVEDSVRKAYPGVAVMTPDELAAIEAADAKSVLLIDARTDAEYGVSRIAGAVHVNPKMPAGEFQTKFAGDLKGRKVVVYCAVGGRSSELANRIEAVAKAAGAESVYSLQGGIFRWHNEKRPLSGPRGASDEVHPFSPNAERLIERQEGIAYRPGTSKLSKNE